MFATLLGPLPRPPLGAEASDRELVEAAVRAQEAAGIEPITDGGLGDLESPVERWRITAALTTRAVKQALLGPYTVGRAGVGDASGPAAREETTLAAADALNADLRALASAGCPLIEIHEPAATAIGADERERALFREAHRRLFDGVEGPHLSLAITGGNADAAAVETLLSAPYASLALDLIAGPDNWRLVVATPGDCGIVCGALSPELGSDDGPELLLWAVAYAASTGSRGPARVGLATASSLAGLPWDAAITKLRRLGEAARLADLPPGKLRRSIDPRAVDIRSAALGRVEPRRPSRRRRPGL
jgi:methionine synthase II (cobalamin-independent)